MTDKACPCCGARTGQLMPADILDALAIGGRSQRALAETLARHFGQFVPVPRLADLIYAGDPNGGPGDAENTVRMLALKLRRRLDGSALRIESRYGCGYRMVWAPVTTVLRSAA